MSWSASGTMNNDGIAVVVSPPEDQLNITAKAQYDFMVDFFKSAFEGGHLESSYSVSLHGHGNAEPTSDFDRKTLGFSLSPVKLEVEAAAEASDSP